MTTLAPRIALVRPHVRGATAAGAGAVAAAAALALAAHGPAELNPFYDAAVRSMSRSLHAFWVGGFDPRATVAVDKPAPALWAQVGAVKLLGFTPGALLAPAALATVAAVAGMVALAGPAAGWALALLPVAILTGRSDTPDALMAAALVAAALAAVRAGRMRWALAAGAAFGLAFEVKLAEAAIALPALAAAVAVAAGPGAMRRAARVGAFAVAAAAVGLAWPLALTLTGHHPFVVGSRSGSVWDVIGGYDGASRLAAPTGGSIAPPGPLRLLWPGQPGLGAAIAPGLLAVAVLAAVSAVAVRPRRGRVTPEAVLVVVWLLTGVVVLSAMARLHVRYLEALAPAVAGAVGLAAGRLGRRRWAPALVAAALVPGAVATIHLVAAQRSDGGSPGARPAAEVAALSGYLRAHAGGAAYEAAEATPDVAGPLIARDGRPVLMLSAGKGAPLVTPAALAADVAAGRVRYAYLGVDCGEAAKAGCPASALWARRHGTDVSRAAGLPRPGRLFRLR